MCVRDWSLITGGGGGGGVKKREEGVGGASEVLSLQTEGGGRKRFRTCDFPIL